MAEAIPFIMAAFVAAAGFSEYNRIDNEADTAIQEAKWNREVLKRQASNEAYKAGLDEDQARREVAFSQARTRAGLLQAGIGTHLGSSAIAVSGQAAKFGELDALNIRHAGDMSVLSLLTQAEGQTAQIDSLRSQRSAAKKGQILKTIGSTLSAFVGGGGLDAKPIAPTGGQVAGRTTIAAGRGAGANARFFTPTATSVRPSIG